MNKKIVTIGILVLGALVIPIAFEQMKAKANPQGFSNESITNIRAIQKGLYNDAYDTTENDSRIPHIIDVNYYINVSGEPTGTYLIYKVRALIPKDININSLNTVNKTVKNTIKDYAKDTWNWTLPDAKIRIIPLISGSDIV